MSMDNLDGSGFLDIGKKRFIELTVENGGLGKWTAGKLYETIKNFNVGQIHKQAV